MCHRLAAHRPIGAGLGLRRQSISTESRTLCGTRRQSVTNRCHPAALGAELPRQVLPLDLLSSTQKLPRRARRSSITSRPPPGLLGTSGIRSASHSICSFVSRIVIQGYSRLQHQRLRGSRIGSTILPNTTAFKALLGTSNMHNMQSMGASGTDIVAN